MSQVMSNREKELANSDILKLLASFAIPAIISNLVSSLYNIADQIFIGQYEGILGNAATNVAFPIVTILTGVSLMIGVGSASKFNLEMGKKNPDLAKNYIGNGIIYMFIAGFSLMIITQVFLEPLLLLFGATEQVLPYAMTYTRITSLGFPFLVLIIAGSQYIRSDGSPKYAMATTLTGAILNTILNPLLIFTFDMGIAGGAWATVIGQAVSAIMILYYFTDFKMIKLHRDDFKLRLEIFTTTAKLGSAAAINQVAIALVQTVSNNTLAYYGALSVYGSDIPLAVVGVGSKINMLYFGFLIGIAQGIQPIIGYNYGAENYKRVKDTLFTALKVGVGLGTIAFICFQLFPVAIISVFGKGDQLYYEFGTLYLRIYLLFTMVNGIQMITSNYFTSVGKANKGIFLSLTRQVIFLIPLIISLPIKFGVKGVMYAAPIADFFAISLAIIFLIIEVRNLDLLSSQTELVFEN